MSQEPALYGPATLSAREATALATYEQVIATGLQTFVAVGTALLAIRDGRLYRATHPTFEAYCQERWEMKRSYAYELIDAAQVAHNVRNSGQHLTAVSQARPLTTLEPDAQRTAWAEAVATAPGGKVTAAHVQAVVQQMRPAPLPSPDEARPRLTAAERRARQAAATRHAQFMPVFHLLWQLGEAVNMPLPSDASWSPEDLAATQTVRQRLPTPEAIMAAMEPPFVEEMGQRLTDALAILTALHAAWQAHQATPPEEP
jgi:hypothetical protein